MLKFDDLKEELIIDDGYEVVQVQIEDECPISDDGARMFKRLTGGRLMVRTLFEGDMRAIINFMVVNGRAFSYTFQGNDHVRISRR